MTAAVLPLPVIRRGRAYAYGPHGWCRNCTKALHAHPNVGCSQCGNRHRACDVTATGWSHCQDHRGSK